jgi:hypothetical protein
LYIFVYCLLHWLMKPILQSGGYIIYSYMFHIMKYYLYCICFIFVQPTSLPQLWKTSHDRARWLKYLTAWTLSWKQTRRDAWLDSHSKLQFARLCMHEYSGHEPRDQRSLSLAWSEINLSIRGDSIPMQLRQIKVFKCLVRRAQPLCHTATTLRTDHIWEKHQGNAWDIKARQDWSVNMAINNWLLACKASWDKLYTMPNPR